MPEPENNVNPGFVTPASRQGGSHLDPDAGGVMPAAEGPGDHMTPDFGAAVRPPTGSHLDSDVPGSDTVEPVATRPSTGDHLTPDLP